MKTEDVLLFVALAVGFYLLWGINRLNMKVMLMGRALLEAQYHLHHKRASDSHQGEPLAGFAEMACAEIRRLNLASQPKAISELLKLWGCSPSELKQVASMLGYMKERDQSR